MSSDALRFGLLATGSIAAEFAEALHSSERCLAAAVASRERARAVAFGERHRVFGTSGSPGAARCST